MNGAGGSGQEYSRRKLPRGFYARGALALAPALLGKVLVHEAPEGRTSGMIVEVEAYCGPHDRAAHSFGGRPTQRTRAMFGPPGRAYIFFVYGMHYCFNVVAAGRGQPEAVLVRALEPLEGVALMARRRRLPVRTARDLVRLTNGPGKLTAALGINMDLYGADLTGDRLFLEEGRPVDRDEIVASPRIGVTYAGEWADRPWRFSLRDNPYVSVPPRT
ncbi:MAG: DNA-3-methyladenine glycosylase [Bacillota bacterium]|nr:DNA-3-methyladenine glycosylase [Bacillota bacterium]